MRTMPGCRRWAVITVGMATLALGLGMVTTPPAGAAKKPTACTILASGAIAKIVGAPVSAGDPGSGGYGCGFDVGPGLGEPGGGLVVLQLYTGPMASSIFSAAKSGEKVGKVYWDPLTGIATANKKGVTIGASYSITGTKAAEHKDQAIALVEAARKAL